MLAEPPFRDTHPIKLLPPLPLLPLPPPLPLPAFAHQEWADPSSGVERLRGLLSTVKPKSPSFRIS